ncbi:MAG: hypothetical protein JW917_07540 [Ignavibacteria bacterium]|nr:hypothetical protein [Ignavibacteria bacterium]
MQNSQITNENGKIYFSSSGKKINIGKLSNKTLYIYRNSKTQILRKLNSIGLCYDVFNRLEFDVLCLCLDKKNLYISKINASIQGLIRKFTATETQIFIPLQFFTTEKPEVNDLAECLQWKNDVAVKLRNVAGALNTIQQRLF